MYVCMYVLYKHTVTNKTRKPFSDFFFFVYYKRYEIRYGIDREPLRVTP